MGRTACAEPQCLCKGAQSVCYSTYICRIYLVLAFSFAAEVANLEGLRC